MEKKNIIIAAFAAAAAAAVVTAAAAFERYFTKEEPEIVIHEASTETGTEGKTGQETGQETGLYTAPKETSFFRDTATVILTALPTEKTSETVAAAVPVFPLDLNKATKEELMQLEGIGEVTAEKIIMVRESLGGFINRRQLLEIDGIGEAKLGAIYDKLYIENEDFTEAPPDDPAEEPYVEEAEEEQAEEQGEEIYPAQAEYYSIDLNNATREEIMTVPGMTEEVCDSILSLREKIGRFSDTLELLYADGMTRSKYNEIKSYFRV